MIVELINIQAIKYAKYELSEKGITQIIGDNSNGKSIMFKAIERVITLKIKDEDRRNPLINDYVDEGFVKMIRDDGRELHVDIHRDLNRCLYILTRKNGEKISRTFREGGIEHLVSEFGWIIHGKNEMCSQIFETFGLMPFVNTSDTLNNNIVKSIVYDSKADLFLNNYMNITYPLFKTTASQIKKDIQMLDVKMENTPQYDYESYEELSLKLKRYKRNLDKLTVVKLEYINIPPFVDIVDVPVIVLHKIPLHKYIEPIPMLDSLSKHVSEMSKARDGICPMCGSNIGGVCCEQ